MATGWLRKFPLPSFIKTGKVVVVFLGWAKLAWSLCKASVPNNTVPVEYIDLIHIAVGHASFAQPTKNNRPGGISQSGFSIAEIMVGLIIGSLATVVVLQSWSVFESQKRTTTNTNDAQENSLMAMYILEREARMAGYGMLSQDRFICHSRNMYLNGTATTVAGFMPVQIIDGASGGPDMVSFIYSTAGIGNVPIKLTNTMINSDAILTVDSANGVNAGDIVYLAEPGSTKPCSRLQVTAVTPVIPASNTGPYTLAHSTVANTINPPLGTNIFPTGGYLSDAGKVFDLGSAIENQFRINNNNLEMSATPVVSGVVNLQAQYGIAATNSPVINCWVNATSSGNPGCGMGDWSNPDAGMITRIKAIRIALIARDPKQERTAITSTTLTLLPGSTGTISANAISWTPTGTEQRYRYKIQQATIPLRNLIWAGVK
jgi:type IV pilus assembly protein PilW